MFKLKVLKASISIGLLSISMSVPAMPQDTDKVEGGVAQVSARSWIVVDNPSGNVVSQQNAMERTKVGGLPKLMTALVVARLATADPKVLDKRIAFANYMVKGQGTKTGARGGESMTVRDALYGMLLYSANDAALALSQEFNDRFAQSDFDFLDRIPKRSRSFIAEMNRTARELGMADTIFRSVFIDGGEKSDTTSSARDLARLGVAVMANPLLREIVGTKTYQATIFEDNDQSRKRSWSNRNHFIGSAGVGGILSSATPATGQSLVLALNSRGHDNIIVVLGSSSPSQRDADIKLIEASIE